MHHFDPDLNPKSEKHVNILLNSAKNNYSQLQLTLSNPGSNFFLHQTQAGQLPY